jgi:hypothetical protein
MSEGPVKILQIMPADGWRAHYRSKGQPEVRERIVCFALVELLERGERTQEVRPMTRSDAGVRFCQDAPNFDKISHESESNP